MESRTISLPNGRTGPPLLILCLSLCLAACSEKSPAAPDPAQLLQRISLGDPSKYPAVSRTKNWRNPYLVIRQDGVGVVSNVAANEEKIVKPEELLNELAQLPPAAWPYGRVVAVLVEEKPSNSEQDKVAIRRNRGIVAGVLQGAHVGIEWENPAGS